MTLETFRDTIVQETENRITALTIDSGTSYADLLKAGALFKMAQDLSGHPITPINTVRFLEGADSATLDGWLQTPGNMSTFKTWVNQPSVAQDIAASNIAIVNIAGSPTAMSVAVTSTFIMTPLVESTAALDAILTAETTFAIDSIVGSSVAMEDLSASSYAMGRVASDARFMAAIAASQTAITAVVADTVSSAAIAASSIAMLAMLAKVNALDTLLATTTSAAAVAADTVAMGELIADSNALDKTVQSTVTMTAIANSSLAMGEITTSTPASAAVLTSDVALTAIAADAVALATMNSMVFLNAVIDTEASLNKISAYPPIIAEFSTSQDALSAFGSTEQVADIFASKPNLVDGFINATDSIKFAFITTLAGINSYNATTGYQESVATVAAILSSATYCNLLLSNTITRTLAFSVNTFKDAIWTSTTAVDRMAITFDAFATAPGYFCYLAIPFDFRWVQSTEIHVRPAQDHSYAIYQRPYVYYDGINQYTWFSVNGDTTTWVRYVSNDPKIVENGTKNAYIEYQLEGYSNVYGIDQTATSEVVLSHGTVPVLMTNDDPQWGHRYWGIKFTLRTAS